ncbi:ELL-associated factor 1-like protein [Leptotrombidium deliense]|uniref:Ell-associated factor Eaf n=1 Tax=Leptotrombidium deliense TaxID=299467 RepID=A0A443SLT8_9ACAR|nr:ELL-associated factor 1-like protein [Leptotrombidium deliense]
MSQINYSTQLICIADDFKPASVDTTKTASVEFVENNKATVTVPNVDGSGNAYTVFKGSKKPHQKECVLIIDNETGEITLERLTQNIVVKKTRAEGTSKAQLLQRPITPSMELNGKKTSPPLPGISQQPNHFVPQSSQKSNSPKRNDCSSNSKTKKSLPFATTPQTNQPQSRSSIPVGFIPAQTQNVRPLIKDEEMIGVLSESSSDSSDNESVSGSDDEHPKPIVPNGTSNATHVNNGTEHTVAEMSPSDDSSSDSDSESNSESSDDDNEDDATRDKPVHNLPPSMPNVLNSNLPNNGPSLPSQDLQLSESGSDSD